MPISQCPYCPNAYHQNETGKFKKHLFNHEHVTKTALPHECIQCGKQDFCLQRLQKHIDNFRGPCHNNQCTQCHDFFKTHLDYKVSTYLVLNAEYRYLYLFPINHTGMLIFLFVKITYWVEYFIWHSKLHYKNIL